MAVNSQWNDNDVTSAIQHISVNILNLQNKYIKEKLLKVFEKKKSLAYKKE